MALAKEPARRSANNLVLIKKEPTFINIIECISMIAETFVSAWEDFTPAEALNLEPGEDADLETSLLEDLAESTETIIFEMLNRETCYITAETPFSEIKAAFIDINILNQTIRMANVTLEKQSQLIEMAKSQHPTYARSELPDAIPCEMERVNCDRYGTYWEKKITPRMTEIISTQFAPRIEMIVKGGKQAAPPGMVM